MFATGVNITATGELKLNDGPVIYRYLVVSKSPKLISFQTEAD